MASQMIGVDLKIVLKCIEMDDGMMRLPFLFLFSATYIILSAVTIRCHTHVKYWHLSKTVSTLKCTHRACNHAYQAAGRASSPKRSAPGSWHVAMIQRGPSAVTSQKFILARRLAPPLRGRLSGAFVLRWVDVHKIGVFAFM